MATAARGLIVRWAAAVDEQADGDRCVLHPEEGECLWAPVFEHRERVRTRQADVAGA